MAWSVCSNCNDNRNSRGAAMTPSIFGSWNNEVTTVAALASL
jgi:hypothetical protein